MRLLEWALIQSGEIWTQSMASTEGRCSEDPCRQNFMKIEDDNDVSVKPQNFGRILQARKSQRRIPLQVSEGTCETLIWDFLLLELCEMVCF